MFKTCLFLSLGKYAKADDYQLERVSEIEGEKRQTTDILVKFLVSVVNMTRLKNITRKPSQFPRKSAREKE